MHALPFFIPREIPMARMNIFNTLEQETFESPPVFNSVDRLKFFFAPLLFGDSMESMRTPTNKVCFIVMAGYFKARRKFFCKAVSPIRYRIRSAADRP